MTSGADDRVHTIREVAEEAGVSIGTVSNVLNRPDLVADSTRERVQEVIDRTGFVRNGFAYQLRSRRSLAIGLIVPDTSNPFWTGLARGVEDAAADSGYVVILCNSDAQPDRERKYLQLLEQHRVAGVLLSPVSRKSPALDSLTERGTPVVLLDWRRRKRDHCSVAVDDVYGGTLAAEHLRETGRDKLIFIGGPSTIQQSSERRRGFMRGADALDLTEVTVDSMTIEAGRHAAAKIKARVGRRTGVGVFCANDLIAIGVMQGLLEAGVRIPEEVAIIGYDDVPYVASATVPISSIRQPTYEIGATGTSILLEEMAEAEHVHESVVFKPTLVARRSTARS